MVYIRTYEPPEVNQKEIFRYAGAVKGAEELIPLLNDCMSEVQGRLVYKVCYSEFDIRLDGDILDLGFARTPSKDLRKNLCGCDRIVLFAATVGIEIDRVIARYASFSPSRSLMLQSIGNERVESLCDAFCKEISAEKAECGEVTRPRFSAGYGDLPLEVQRDIFAVLDCPRKIGVTLNESLLMTPSKSVTAIIGITKK